jgi:very-short-patch-repair endonuclease
MALASTQQSLFNLTQGRRAGLNRRAIHHRVQAGRLERFLPEVFAVPGVPDSWERDTSGLLLMYGDGSAASHRAAARLLGFGSFEGAPVEISTVATKRLVVVLRSGRKSLVHRVDAHLLGEIGASQGLQITSPRRTILDLCAINDPRAEGVIDAAVRRGLISIGQLCLYLEQEWMRGRRGVRILRTLLFPRLEGWAPADSEMERLARRLLQEAGLPAPAHQYPVILPSGRIRLDLAYPGSKLAIELDGYAWHMDRRAFERDRERDNQLRAMGWTVLRFTWAVVRYHPASMIELIRSCLS